MKRVTADDVRRTTPVPVARCASLGAHRRVDDRFLGDVVAGELGDAVTTGDHDHPVAEALQLEGVGRGHDHGDTAAPATDRRMR